MKKKMTLAALLAVLLLLGVGTAAEAGEAALFAVRDDGIAVGVAILLIGIPLACAAWCIEDKRKRRHREELERIRAMNPPRSVDVYHHPPVMDGYYQLPPPPKRILIVRVARWFFVRRR